MRSEGRSQIAVSAAKMSRRVASVASRAGGVGIAIALLLSACSKTPSAAVESGTAEGVPAAAEGASAAPAAAAPAAEAAPAAAGPARVGEPAPDFTLSDLDGKSVSLSQFKGKLVVLEWFNPGCPFVRAAHTAGSLKGLAGKYTSDGVVWLAINSGGPGKQGNGVEANRTGSSQWGMGHPILVDESGKVGQLYGAERTPHMFVINPEGVLVYRGAIDNSPDGEGQSPEGGKLVNYVDGAISAVRTGAKVEPAETKPYGCSVKYQSM